MIGLDCSPHLARLAVLAVFLSGCANAGCQPTVTPSNTTGTAETDEPSRGDDQSTQQKSAGQKPIEVPEGTAEELFAFIDQLDERLNSTGVSDDIAADGPSSTDTLQADTLQQLMEARIAACDKILARPVHEDTRLRAISIQLDALRTLLAVDPESTTERFDAYTQRLAAGSDPLLARMAKATRFQAQVNRSLAGSGPGPDELLADLQTMLSEADAGPETLNASREAAGWILQQGDLPTAISALRLIGQRFQNHPDTALAGEGSSLISQAMNLELTQLARRVVQEQPNALNQLLARLKELLDDGDADPNLLAYSMQTAQLLEFAGHPQEALKAYKLIGARYQHESDAELSASVTQSVQLADRRLNLIGKPLLIDGVLPNGDPFDWQSYRRKWVVVCFWATWNQGWLSEVDNIRQAVASRQDPPVEVVSINLDDDRNLLERFLKEHPTYWPVVVDTDPAAAGFENANAIRCGVEAVPFVLLVNPRGEVVDIHVVGDRLAAALAQHVDRVNREKPVAGPGAEESAAP
jgi:hypothetical protein